MDFFRYAYQVSCTPYYQNTFLVDLYITANFVTFFIPFLLLFASYWHKELYTLLFSITSFVNWSLNYALRSLVLKNRTPAGGCTSLKYGMPSLELQQAFFVWTFFLSYILYWRKSFETVFSRLMLVGSITLYLVIVTSGQIALGANTPYQVVVGALVGAALAQVFQDLIFCFVYPHFPTILSNKIIKYLGYRDNMCSNILSDPHRIDFLHRELLPVLIRRTDNTTALLIANDIQSNEKKRRNQL